MSVSNNTRIKLGQSIRNIVRSACTRAPGWDAWRAANLGDRASDQMTTLEIKNASIALGIDIEAIAGAMNIPLTYWDAKSAKAASASGWNPPAALVNNYPVATAPAPGAIDATALTGLVDAIDAIDAGDMGDDDNEDGEDGEDMDMGEELPMGPANTTPGPYEGRDPGAILDEALATVASMFGSGSPVLQTITSAILPIATAAVAGPRSIETIRHVTITAPGATAAPGSTRTCNIVAARSGLDAIKTLGIRPTECGQWRSVLEQSLSIWDGTAAEGVPEIDPDHSWSPEALAYLTIAARHADTNDKLRNMSRVLFYGPAGTGKTSSVEQFAARTGRPYVRIAFDRGTEAPDLLGQRLPKAGDTTFHDGAMVAAMQIPGCVILTDEPSFLRPGIAAVLQTLLDKGAVYLKEDGNRRVEVAPGVMIVAADNTNLSGDETGRYADTITQNMALSDRFAWMVAVDYMTETKEATVLHRKTGIAVAACLPMVRYAGLTRNSASNGQLTSGLSLRRLIAWAIAVKAGIKSEQAFKAAILNPSDASDRETLRTLALNSAPHAAIDAAVHGAPVPATDPTMQGLTSTPAGAAAANAFSAV